MTWFDDIGQRVAVDQRTPIDDLEPEIAPIEGHRSDIGLAEIVLRVAASFREGDPRIIAAAWLYLLRGEDASMRLKARRLGITASALSRRARILAESFGLKLNNPHIRALRRRLATEAWARRKRRRADQSRPAAVCQNSSNPPTKEAAHE